MISKRAKSIVTRISDLLAQTPEKGWKLTIAGALTFLLGALLSPIIGQWGARLGEILGPPQKEVLVAACSPLQEARMVLRYGEQRSSEIIANKRMDFMNETQVLVINNTDQKLTNVTLLIYPIFASGESDKTLFTIMYAGALVGSSSYVVDRKADSYIIRAPVIHAGEYIHVQNHLSQPASYIIELTSDQLTRKAAFAPGCLTGFPDKFKITIPRPFFRYTGERCKDQGIKEPISCTTASPSFDIPEKAKGQELTIETIVINYGKRE